MADGSKDRCDFYLTKKRRYCRFKPNDGQRYCAEHICQLGQIGLPMQLEFKKKLRESLDIGRKRIKCPINPKHSCYEDKLEKHLKKCRKQEKKLPVYYQKEVNAGLISPNDDKETASSKYKIDWNDISLAELQDTIRKIHTTFEKFLSNIEEKFLHHECMNEEMANDSFKIPALRHRKQQSSLIGHMKENGFLGDSTCFVELGAGKGMLSHWVQKAVNEKENTAFVLIDRGHVRYKADNQHRFDENGPKFERIRIDIEDLNLTKVPSIASSDRSIVAMGKHLCGTATDLALRCLVNAHNFSQQRSDCIKDTASVEGQTRVTGIVIALCCHHRCLWKNFVGQEYLQELGFTERDFSILCKLSGWASATWKGWKTVEEMKKDEEESGTIYPPSKKLKMNDDISNNKQECIVKDSEVPEHDQCDNTALNRMDLNLSQEDKELIGWRSKRLIDYGRLRYLQCNGMSSKLTCYIDSRLTPENVAIIAKPCAEIKT